MGFYTKYKDVVEFTELRFSPPVMISLTVVLAVGLFLLGMLFDTILGVLLAILAVDLGLGLPFFLADRKVHEIEERLSDVLHHMSTTLKTGGTIEVALREVSRIDYGPITIGIKGILREMNEGKPFEEAFADFARNSHSELVKRAAIIIIAARKAGGGLLDTLNAMAEDIRAMARLQRERKTKTLMQFLFIMVAGVVIAPVVFGIVKSVLEILLQVGGTGASLGIVGEFDTLFKLYLIIEASLVTLGAVIVREGKWSRAVVYLPIGAVSAYAIYFFVSTMFLKFMGLG